MEAKKAILIVFMTLLLPELVFGAVISGTIYDFELEKAVDTFIEIDTVPKQSFVSKDGKYSFNAHLGNYTIKAAREDSSAEEQVVIAADGQYNIDLILFPDFSDEEDILRETGLDVSMDYLSEKNYARYYLAGFSVFILLVLLGAVYYARRVKKQIKEEIHELQIAEKEDSIPAELKEIIDFIKKEGGRTTQKDIRKSFPQSEAKISLMVAELEEAGKIKKIKKGRGNIIALK